MNRLGQVKPELTGDGTNIMPVDSNLIKEDVKVKVTLNDYTGALLLCGTIYAVGRLFSKVLLPSVFGAQIHTFAYSIIFLIFLIIMGGSQKIFGFWYHHRRNYVKRSTYLECECYEKDMERFRSI